MEIQVLHRDRNSVKTLRFHMLGCIHTVTLSPLLRERNQQRKSCHSSGCISSCIIASDGWGSPPLSGILSLDPTKGQWGEQSLSSALGN